ncbi:hypothetical protein SKAU_G00166750 [Synaphobranchus kaupii]|uniref:Uncharacterized protein n=1 Tax=Synaphobranchus kaupii TaxID=118154 RepID=A0A9Q1J0B1_SYNKA|nr:hypothetical protein SKAU_G00166750 [Synaphobranchus kaupii]
MDWLYMQEDCVSPVMQSQVTELQKLPLENRTGFSNLPCPSLPFPALHSLRPTQPHPTLLRSACPPDDQIDTPSPPDSLSAYQRPALGGGRTAWQDVGQRGAQMAGPSCVRQERRLGLKRSGVPPQSPVQHQHL